MLESFHKRQGWEGYRGKTISLILNKINENNADNAEVALAFMNPEELDSPEDDSAEILVKVVIRRI
jgi:hypothetical protein